MPGDPSDGQLVARFVQDQDEAAFARLVERHGPLVLAACRRMCESTADADDAFQVVFLTLAMKAARLRQGGTSVRGSTAWRVTWRCANARRARLDGVASRRSRPVP